MRGFMRRTPTCALHVHVGMPDPETRDPRLQRAALLPAGAAGPGRALAVLARPRLGLRERPRAAVPRLPARGHPARLRELGALRGLRRALAGGRRRARLHVPVVGHPPAPAAGHGRAARDGRAVAARPPWPGCRRSCTGWRSRCSTARADPPVPGAEIVESSFRAGRDGLARDPCAGTARCARCASWPRRRWRSRARRYASAAPTAHSRRPSGSCARATAPTGCAPRTPRGGMRAVLERLVDEAAQARRPEAPAGARTAASPPARPPPRRASARSPAAPASSGRRRARARC